MGSMSHRGPFRYQPKKTLGEDRDRSSRNDRTRSSELDSFQVSNCMCFPYYYSEILTRLFMKLNDDYLYTLSLFVLEPLVSLRSPTCCVTTYSWPSGGSNDTAGASYRLWSVMFACFVYLISSHSHVIVGVFRVLERDRYQDEYQRHS